MRFAGSALAMCAVLYISAGAEAASQSTATTISTISRGTYAIDYRNAKPKPMPQATGTSPAGAVQPSGESNASPKLWPGFVGSGVMHPVSLPIPVSPAPAPTPSGPGVSNPLDYGTAKVPFTTVRVAAFNDPTQNYYPFRATGKLFFNENGAGYMCSASLIRPGLVVTAAHCVANFGSRQLYTDFQFIPAYDRGAAPYGTWSTVAATVMTAYLNGTDSCHQKGVICRDDIAVLTLASQNGQYAGNATGWYGVGMNGYSFVSNTASITQLGYPKAFDDGGLVMERNDAQGVVSSTYSYNTLLGSLMTAGSSGGPWLVNFGMPPTLDGTANGQAPNNNVIVGVTSFGWNNDAYKRQGASSFTTANIGSILNSACAANPGAC